jgi:hypothetical protein
MAVLLGLLAIPTSEVRRRKLRGIEEDSSLFRVEPVVKHMNADPAERSLD